ncbi:MAG TPA: hypothetical protein VGD71_00725 [Kribbella sp.]
MLSLETPAVRIGEVLVFPDHAVPGTFYYAAPDPKISRTGGQLMVDILSYSVELKHSPLAGTTIPHELGAGFLTLGLDCALDPTVHSRTIGELSARTGLPEQQLSLSPIPYTKGAVSLIALDAGTTESGGLPQFVEKVIGGGTPSLLGDLRASFSLALSQEGVEFLEGLYKDGAAPIGVVYDLTYLGLRPAIQCVITADLSRIYDELSASVGVQYLCFRAEVEAILSKLADTEAIGIQLTSQAVGEEAARSKESALSLFKDRIIRELFRPTATPQLANLAVPGEQSTGAVSLSLKVKDREELKHVVYRFDERSPEERTHAPHGFLAALLSESEMDERVHRIDLASPFFELLEVLVTGPTEQEFTALGLHSVTALLTYGLLGDPVPPEQESVEFRPGSSGRKIFAMTRRGRPSLAYTVELAYEFSRIAGTDADVLTFTTPPVEHTGRTLTINPYADVGVLDVEVDTGPVDPTVRQIDVALSYLDELSGFSAAHTIRLVPTATTATADRHWQVRTRQLGERFYTATPTFTFDDATFTAPPIRTDTSLLRVDSPFTSTRTVLVQPNVTAADASQVTVEVVYDDETAGYHRRFTTTLAPDPVTRVWSSATLSWPILDPARQHLKYRVSTLAGGTVDTTDWTSSDEPSLLVGETGRRMRTLDVRLVGPTLAEAGLDAIEVRVTLPGDADDTAKSLFFDSATQASLSVALPATADVPLGFRYQVVAFHTDGSQGVGPWQTTGSALVVVQTQTSRRHG